MGVIPDAPRLAERQELCKPKLIDLVRQAPPCLCQSRRSAPDQLCWPFEIIDAVMRGLQRPKQCVIFQPMSVDVTELLIGGSQVSACPAAEGSPRCLEQPLLERNDGVIINERCRERGARAIASPQQSVLDQAVRADQELVAGE